MKHLFLPLLAVVFLASCNQNNPEASKQIQFNISAFEQSNEPLNAPAHISPKAKAVILDDTDGKPLTDLYIFDGTTQLAHQTSDQDDFGPITLSLTHGNHNLSFVCTRSTGLTYDQGTLSATSVKPTFGTLYPLTVDASTTAQTVTLQRISGQLNITIQDAFPTNATDIEFIINPRYTDLNISTLCAVNGESVTQRVSCSDKAGKTNQSFSFTHLAPSLDQEYTAQVTINTYAGSTLLHSVLINDVRLAANTKTVLTGNAFRSPSATVNADHSWNTDLVGSF